MTATGGAMSLACSIDWKLFLEYLKVLLAWPVVVGVGATIGTLWFRTELRALINRVASLEFPGGKIVTQQTKLEEDALVNEVVESVPAEADVPSVLDEIHLSAVDQKKIRDVIVAERAAARVWEYRYLNYYFAPATQHVLDWLIGLNITTDAAYDAYWINRIPQTAERRAIIDALQKHLCIHIDGPSYQVSDKGREYAAWPERRILSVVERALER
jgi:translation initiation factor 2 gamma subunit (eIF-2gamma)